MNIETIILLIFIIILSAYFTTGCRKTEYKPANSTNAENIITPTDKISGLDDDLYVVKYDGDYGLDKFINQGGASSDKDVVRFLAENVLIGTDLFFAKNIFGCSTISAQSTEGNQLFGRNFDWNHCRAMIISSRPNNGYTSVSTDNHQRFNAKLYDNQQQDSG